MEIKRGDIWYVNYGYNVGSEIASGRPAIIVSNDVNNKFSTVCEVVYLTTAPKRDLPTHVIIMSTGRESIALCEQVSTVSIDRLGTRKGRVTDEEMARVEKAIQVSLGLTVSEQGAVSPDPFTHLAAVEAKCKVLQEMYDSLLEKIIRAG